MNQIPQVHLHADSSLLKHDLIQDIIDSLDLEHAFTWLLEALEHADRAHQNDMHVFHLNLYTIYVDFHDRKLRITSNLAIHGEDLVVELTEFMHILQSLSPHERQPRHYVKTMHYQLIHQFDNRHYKRKPYGHLAPQRSVSYHD